jgi:hypothetical protein
LVNLVHLNLQTVGPLQSRLPCLIRPIHDEFRTYSTKIDHQLKVFPMENFVSIANFFISAPVDMGLCSYRGILRVVEKGSMWALMPGVMDLLISQTTIHE